MATESEQAKFDELCFYTLAHRDPSFIHQLAVDAYAAQNARESEKPIRLTFALIGLYLHMEKQYSGRDVQRAHMQLAKTRRPWPRFQLPEQRGSVRVSDILAAPPGRERDASIERWCASVWAAWHDSHDQVRALVGDHLR
ncbi:MAG: hypothetical protein DMG61_21430 [Acidobacteria bacterium]|nr:MAG: hypothetical protein DMG61_21430 [Acidobacteriota bacterium]